MATVATRAAKRELAPDWRDSLRETARRFFVRTGGVLLFSAASMLLTYLVLRLQHALPLNPQGLPAVSDRQSFETAASFTTTRAVNVPGISVDVGAMVDALRRVAGDAAASRVRWQLDPAIDRIVRTWPRDFEARFGRALGMRADADFESIVRQYVADERPTAR